MKASWHEFKVNAIHKGEKAAGWGSERIPENYNHHRVTVVNQETGKRTSFDYWTSQAHPDMRDAKDALLAFMAFVDDAISGHYDFDEFCRELGYEKPSEAYKAWRGCVRALDKVKRIAGERDVYALANALQDVDR